MFKSLVIAATLAIGSLAHADGFVCETQSGLVVQVYNHVQPEVGTRVPAVMVVSDSNIQEGRKTIAKFSEAKGTLSKDGYQTYVANVDLRFNDSSRKGELLAGTKLGNVDEIKLYVEYSPLAPVAEGVQLDGTLTLIKRNSGLISEQAVCTRYLKN